MNNTLDFDQAVNFVSKWVAQLQSYLSVNRWAYTSDGTHHWGISKSERAELVEHLFAKIWHSDRPQILMEALSVHLSSLTNISNKYNLPKTYVSESKDTNHATWDTKIFCQALDYDVAQLMSVWTCCSEVGAKYLSTEVKKNKM